MEGGSERVKLRKNNKREIATRKREINRKRERDKLSEGV